MPEPIIKTATPMTILRDEKTIRHMNVEYISCKDMQGNSLHKAGAVPDPSTARNRLAA